MTELTEQQQDFSGPDACASALQALLASARRRVRIASRALEHSVYSLPGTVQSLSEFARRSRYSRLEIQVGSTEPMLQRSHRLLPLLQRLGSRIELRSLQDSEDAPPFDLGEYILGDDDQLLLVKDPALWVGVYMPDDRARVRKYDDQFSQTWNFAREDTNLRRLVI